MRKQLLVELFAALLIILFLYTSVSKFLDFRHFMDDMGNQPLPSRWKPFLVWIIPVSEILISLALVTEYTRMAGFQASLALMGLYTIYTMSVLLHAFKYIPCSCGGVIKSLSWKQHLYFNIFFTGVALAGIYLQRSRKKPDIKSQDTIPHLKKHLV
jgi:hypothetical protein